MSADHCQQDDYLRLVDSYLDFYLCPGLYPGPFRRRVGPLIVTLILTSTYPS